MRPLIANLLALTALAGALPGARSAGLRNIVLTNDDGWAEAQIRAEYDALRAAGFNVVLSAPAVDKSGTGSSTATPVPLADPCEYDSCPAGSPAIGTDPNDPNIHYVNAFPVDAVRAGIQTFAPEVFGGPPDFVISGSNVGSNIVVIGGSGTVGAASEAVLEGIPSFAFSSATTDHVSYTTLETQPDAKSSIAAHIYTELVLKFINTYLSAESDGPLLPPGVSVNVNFNAIDNCPNGAADYKFIATRLVLSLLGKDTRLCGSNNLPDELRVNLNAGCYASVTVFDISDKSDADAEAQSQVFSRLAPILSCFDHIL